LQGPIKIPQPHSTFEEGIIEPAYFMSNWNATQNFPHLEPQQFSQAMQSLNDYSLHIVAAADIAHHLKFDNYNDIVSLSISNLFSNPMHTITIAFAAIVILYLLYTLYIE
jgi:hypothetical protein